MVKQMLFQQNVQLWEYDKEQWEFANDSGQWRKVIHLPIDFKSFSSILAVGINSDDSANCGYHLNSKELNSFSYVYGVSLCYIAIGV